MTDYRIAYAGRQKVPANVTCRGWRVSKGWLCPCTKGLSWDRLSVPGILPGKDPRRGGRRSATGVRSWLLDAVELEGSNGES